MVIYKADGTERLDFDSYNIGSKLNRTLMGDDYIVIPFVSSSPIDFAFGDYHDVYIGGYCYGRYEIIDKYKPTYDTTTATYKYDLRLDATYMKWKNKICKYNPQTGGSELSFSLTSTIVVHASIIVQNIIQLGYKFNGVDYAVVFDDTIDSNVAKLVTYDSISIIDALTSIAKAFDCEWWVTDNIIHFGTCQAPGSVDEIVFELANNISDMSKSENGQTYITKLFVFGSDRNLPPSYKSSRDPDLTKSAVVQRRLMLPTTSELTPQNAELLSSHGYALSDDSSIIINGLETEELVEGVLVVDDIYPKTECVVSSVDIYTDTVEEDDGTETTNTYYRVKDASGFVFDDDYILEGQTLHILFYSGKLNGMDFECQYSGGEDPYYEIIANENYGRLLPDTTLRPEIGDKFALYNWDASKLTETGLIPAASNELLVKGVEYLDRSKIDPNTYSCTEDCVESDYTIHDIGDKVRLVNPAYFPNGRSSRIIGLEINLDLPYDHPTYQCAEKADYIYQSHVERSDTLTFNGLSYESYSIGGGTVYLIRVNDHTRPTDSNTFSAKRILNDFLRKNVDDSAAGKITFQQGWNGGAFTPDLTGAGLWKDGDNNWHIESDYLHARKKLVAKEVQIEDVHHVGGQQLLTAASMHADYVVNMDGAWRCFFLKEDDNQRQVTNNWKVGDQAYVNTFNLERQEDGTIGNHRLWRLVTATSNEAPDTNTYTVDGETFDASNYHYIDLSKDICDELSDAPKQGDDIVQLGHQGDDRDRQNAIIIAGAGESSPYIREITGIVTFHLPDAETQLKPNDNKLTGKVQMVSGSTFPDGSNVEQFINNTNSNIDGLQNTIETLDTGNENLLLNTGFTGDFTDEEVRSDDDVEDSTEMYSRQLKHWSYENVEVVPTANSASGYGVRLSSGSLSQVLTKPMTNGTWYCISFKASGSSVAVSLGGYQQVVTLTDSVKRYIVKMACEDANVNTFTLSGATGLFMEVQVTEGRIPNTDWLPSPQDNDKSLAYYQNLSYLMSAITNASTTILGGLILSQMLRVGNYRDGVMTEETGGMSGLYMNDNSPFLWGGGDMDKAFYTINKYAQNPAYQPTDEEVSQMAKFVVTHGGRAILNDIILRGYIYALGGVFNGTVYANSGVFKNVHSPNYSFEIDETGNFSCKDAKISGNMYIPLFEITNENAHNYLTPDQTTGNYSVKLDLTGLNLQISGTPFGVGNITISLPNMSIYNGAKIHIRSAMENYKVIVGMGGHYSVVELDYGQVGVFLCFHGSGDNYYWTKIN